MSRLPNITTSMDQTDGELDRDWKPNGRRPQSTIARSFGAELMDIFRIDDSAADLADLDNKLVKRKQEVSTQTTELEALERRIREMEERLQHSKPGAPAGANSVGNKIPQAGQDASAPVQKDLSQRASRPGTAKTQQQAPVQGGAMPPTPTASEGEYELVPEPHYSNSMYSTRTYNDSESGLETESFADLVVVSKDGDHDS